MAHRRHTPFRKNKFKFKLKQETVYSIALVFLVGIALLITLSFTRKGTILLSLNMMLTNGFGWTAIFLPPILTVVALMFTKMKKPINQPNTLVGLLLFAMSLGGVSRAGILGQEIWFGLSTLITGAGAAVVLLSGATIGLLILFNLSIEQALENLGKIFSRRKDQSLQSALKPVISREGPIKIQRPQEQGKQNKQPTSKGSEELLTPTMVANVSGRPVPWQYPPLNLLSDGSTGSKADAGDPKNNAAIIERTLLRLISDRRLLNMPWRSRQELNCQN